MSVIQLLVIDPDKLPSMAELKAHAAASEPAFRPHDADPQTHTGFWPVEIEGTTTGFEYYFEPIEAGALPDEATRFGSCQMISRTGGDLHEAFASLLFLRAAAELTGGAYVYPDDEIVVPPQEVDGFLAAQIQQLRKFLK